ncbi:unnamed protein product [Pleuronectes platessa]|uniref:Uncharacterized protein n=1 Tax=Pleuronectes platessa TaxID=8262 RepID=A0A9N7W2Q0_PLEPL|nr:unnamed protein product [Pleuronectes platessa]
MHLHREGPSTEPGFEPGTFHSASWQSKDPPAVNMNQIPSEASGRDRDNSDRNVVKSLVVNLQHGSEAHSKLGLLLRDTCLQPDQFNMTGELAERRSRPGSQQLSRGVIDICGSSARPLRPKAWLHNELFFFFFCCCCLPCFSHLHCREGRRLRLSVCYKCTLTHSAAAPSRWDLSSRDLSSRDLLPRHQAAVDPEPVLSRFGDNRESVNEALQGASDGDSSAPERQQIESRLHLLLMREMFAGGPSGANRLLPALSQAVMKTRGSRRQGWSRVKLWGWKLRKIIVQGFNRVSEARLSASKEGGLESSNTRSVWSVELLSKQAVVRSQAW